MKPLTINIEFEGGSKTIEYSGAEPSKFISLFLKYIGIADNGSEKLIADADKQELDERLQEIFNEQVKPITLAELDKKIAARKK